MNILFYIACFLLPFENLVIAPSAGWATISPIILFLYLCFNVGYIDKEIIRYRKILGIIAIGLLITLLNYLFISSYLEESILRTINTLISLGLGITSLFAFDIFFIQRKGSIKKIEKILLLAYTIALIIGIIQFLTINFNINFIRVIDELFTKRSYLPFNRVQFTFTEPSFIGMHLFGVLLPIYFYGKNQALKKLIIAFSIASILVGSGIRIILDILVVTTIYILYKIDIRKIKNIVLIILTGIVIIGGIQYEYENNWRVRGIINEGVYADGSFAARWFRVNASFKGYQNDIPHALIGYGFGQEILPLKKGYREAVNEYRHMTYLREVMFLYDAERTAEESTSYSLYTRLISEFGLIMFVYFLLLYTKVYISVVEKEWKAMLIIMAYLYLQFESYAFYTLWLLIVLMQMKYYEIGKNIYRK